MASASLDRLACAMSEQTGGPGHRKLRAWQEAQALAVLTYRICAAKRRTIDVGLMNQIRRAAISISSNIAEGNARGTNKESLRFLYIARGSLCELESQVDVCLSTRLLSKEEAESLTLQSTLVGRLIGGLILYRKNRQSASEDDATPEG